MGDGKWELKHLENMLFWIMENIMRKSHYEAITLYEANKQNYDSKIFFLNKNEGSL